MSSRGGCGAAPSAVVSSADEPPGRSDLGRRRTPQLQVQATEVPAEAGRGRQSGSPQVKPTILTLPRPWQCPGYPTLTKDPDTVIAKATHPRRRERQQTSDTEHYTCSNCFSMPALNL